MGTVPFHLFQVALDRIHLPPSDRVSPVNSETRRQPPVTLMWRLTEMLASPLAILKS